MTPLNHNLVVDGPGAYFVGRSRLLVHDNRVFRPTDQLLPGLAKDEDRAE